MYKIDFSQLFVAAVTMNDGLDHRKWYERDKNNKCYHHTNLDIYYSK